MAAPAAVTKEEMMTDITTGDTTEGTRATVSLSVADERVSLGIAGFNVLLDKDQVEAVADALYDAIEDTETDTETDDLVAAAEAAEAAAEKEAAEQKLAADAAAKTAATKATSASKTTK